MMINTEKCPKTYIGLALISLYFNPLLGLIPIFNALSVKKHWNHGDIDKAIEKSRKAKVWSWFSIISGITLVTITLTQI